MDNKSTVHEVIETIICVLLIGVIVIGGILIYKNTDNPTFKGNTSEVTEQKDKDNSNTKEEEKKKTDTTVSIAENTEVPKASSNDSESTITQNVITPPPEEITNFTVGGEYIADVYSFLALRNASNTSATCVAKLAPCTSLIVISNSTNGMVYVRVNGGLYSGYTGYVFGEYLTKNGEALSRGSMCSDYFYVYGTKDYLPLRSVPQIDDKYLIEKLYNGDNVMLLEETDCKFWKVKDMENNKEGYVVCDYLNR